MNWSSTSSYFRNLLAPYIFKTVKLINNDKSATSLDALANGTRNALVKELYFISPALGDAHSHSKESAFLYTNGILSRTAEALLYDLQRFPSLERLSVRFGYDSRGLIGVPHVFGEAEKTFQAEASAAWRTLMSNTYSALAKSKSPHFKHLEIKQLIWNKVSTVASLLGYLDKFTFSIHYKDDDAGWRSNKIEGYPALMERLDEYSLNHPEERPLGLEGMACTSRFIFGIGEPAVHSTANRIICWPY